MPDIRHLSTQPMRAHLLTLHLRAGLPWLIAATLAGAVFLFLFTVLPGVQAIEFDLALDHDDFLRVYYTNTGSFDATKASAPVLAGPARARHAPYPKAGSFNRIRFDPGEQRGTARLYGMRVSSYFAPTLELGPRQIADLFVAGKPGVELRLAGDHVTITATVDDPFLVSKDRLYPRLVAPALAVALVWATVSGLVVRAWLAGRDTPARPRPDEPARMAALDGLRGYAALLVLADHTMGWFRGVGTSGVYIFFALSGFLLARPYIREPQRAWSLRELSAYLLRRFTRILPMYWTYLFVVFALTNRFDEALLHALFVAGSGHLWAIPQEILFYLLLPLLLLPLAACNRLGRWLPPLVVGALMLLWNRYGSTETVWLLGMNFIRLKFLLGVFLAGVLAAFAHEHLESRTPAPGQVLHRLWSPLGLVLLVFFVLCSTGRLYGDALVLGQRYFGLYGTLAALLVLCSVRADGAGTLLARLLTITPLRRLGVIGLSLYLLHPLVKSLIDALLFHYTSRHLHGLPLFLLTLAGTAALANWTHARIEQPAAAVTGQGRGRTPESTSRPDEESQKG